MHPSEIPAALQDAIMLAQNGQHTEARRLLEQIVEADPRQEMAWMWLASVATSRADRVTFLERALALNPANTTAQNAYLQLTGQAFAAPAAQPVMPDSSRGLLRAAAIVITMLVLVIAAAFVLAGQLVEDDSGSSRPIPTLRPIGDQPAGALDVFPTITRTPFPTRTPGPSPTSIWAAPPPTWTPPPAGSPVPTRTPAPSFTPLPTAESFLGPWALSATAAYIQTSDAGPATVEYVQTQAAITPTRSP